MIHDHFIKMQGSPGSKALILQLQTKGIRDRAVLNALERVPREAFVRQEDLPAAYEDRPLSIGFDQTISQPWMVAHMTEWAAIRPTDRVLEIGTGCGYQTAILAELASQVFTVERITELQAPAKERLKRLGYMNIEFCVGDGTRGWPLHAPYDVILVTAAPEVVPQALTDQLNDGGRLVIPAGPLGPPPDQRLLRITRRGSDFVTERGVAVKFVPLVTEY